MERIKFKIDISFWLFILISILLKRGYFAAMYSIVVVLHEMAHYVVANKLFYHCREIRLGIFGAVLYGDFEDVEKSAEIKIAAAGPLVNICLCLLSLAAWWLYPDSYAFTQDFCEANLSMAAVNLLPCYPLDGGRIFTAVLQKRYSRVVAIGITKKITIGVSVWLFVVFMLTLATGSVFFNVGTFAVCLFVGVFAQSGGECYVKSAVMNHKRKLLKKGMEKKTLVFEQNNTVGNVAKRMQGNYLFCLDVVNEDMVTVRRFSIAELEHIVISYSPDTVLSQIPSIKV